MTSTADTAGMRLVGGLQVDAPDGDHSLYHSLFARMTAEVENTGNLTRYVGYESFRDGKDHLRFLGIEVDRIGDIPDGMIAWDLGESTLTVSQAKDGQNAVIWRDDVTWQWREQLPSDCGRGVTGEFSARIPAAWSGKGTSEYRHFWVSANAYVAPGKNGCDDDVALAEYDPSWPQQYEEAAHWLRDHLGSDIILSVEHFGSTAIPGMPAKPIIDILVEIPSFSEAKRRVLPLLNSQTWEYWWYQGKMMFVKRHKLMGRRTQHVHMMPSGRSRRERLAFRDHLRSDPKDASRYAALKRELAKSHRKDRERYTEAKSDFVSRIVSKASNDP